MGPNAGVESVPHQQQEVRHVSERYIAKSDPFIVMVSTPNRPGGLLEESKRNLMIPVSTRNYFCIGPKVWVRYTPRRK
ncbi:MAG TPA: hypothetical protein VFR94_08345 [Nitrososphaeraceae archaeon]|nr:hypothetical protein [Nitrososphaeraceae archaeon]